MWVLPPLSKCQPQTVSPMNVAKIMSIFVVFIVRIHFLDKTYLDNGKHIPEILRNNLPNVYILE